MYIPSEPPMMRPAFVCCCCCGLPTIGCSFSSSLIVPVYKYSVVLNGVTSRCHITITTFPGLLWLPGYVLYRNQTVLYTYTCISSTHTFAPAESLEETAPVTGVNFENARGESSKEISRDSGLFISIIADVFEKVRESSFMRARISWSLIIVWSWCSSPRNAGNVSFASWRTWIHKCIQKNIPLLMSMFASVAYVLLNFSFALRISSFCFDISPALLRRSVSRSAFSWEVFSWEENCAFSSEPALSASRSTFSSETRCACSSASSIDDSVFIHSYHIVNSENCWVPTLWRFGFGVQEARLTDCKHFTTKGILFLFRSLSPCRWTLSQEVLSRWKLAYPPAFAVPRSTTQRISELEDSWSQVRSYNNL